jgi:hypothetical protein
MEQKYILRNKKSGFFYDGHRTSREPGFYPLPTARGIRTKLYRWKDAKEGDIEIIPVTITLGEPIE